MKYEIKNKEIHIFIRISNSGKFRFKTRKHGLEFGKSFATRSNTFNRDVYLEWQIGYDATEKDLKDRKKYTKLDNLSFVGYNKKTKYPYELSELTYETVKIGLVGVDDLKKLGNKIESYNQFLGDRQIDASRKGKVTINGVSFKETAIQLPTFIAKNREDETQIEVSIQKQQYATGVQPMLYFAIPISCFLNGRDFYGQTAKQEDTLVYIISRDNAKILLRMFDIFGMASPAHNYDVREIIKALISLLERSV